MAFTNRFPVKCSRCGALCERGASMNWNRKKGADSKWWHDPACPNGQRESQTETDETETRNRNASAGWIDGLAGAMLPFLENRLATKLDADEVETIVKRLLDGAILLSATEVIVHDAKSSETRSAGIQHKEFPTLLALCEAGVNVWLTGPAGSGKTTGVEKVAETLNRRFFHIGAMDNEYKLMGFVDAQGRVVHTVFREWWEQGGVICLDEVDSWLPAAALALNGALANGHCAFPDGMEKRHEDCVVIACANTWGSGATTDYVGRMKHDAAFVDRFVQLDWPYDEALEVSIAGNAEWTRRVQTLRANAKAKGLKVIISPRASINGAKLLARGMAQDRVEQVTIRKGMTQEQWGSIQ